MSPKKIQKLVEKKHRTETGLFIVEGEKNILELFKSDFTIVCLLGTKQFLDVYKNQIDSYQDDLGESIEMSEVDESVLVRTGSLLSNNAGIAVAQQNDEVSIDSILEEATQNIVIVLDDIRDPGNMGTILRTADWYGITHIAASPTTTDFYNPKVISASMGSFTRMRVAYIPLTELLQKASERNIPITVGDLAGKSTHEGGLPKNGFLLVGSESHGVSEEALSYATDRVMIPRFGNAESLNVSMATGILLDTMRRGF